MAVELWKTGEKKGIFSRKQRKNEMRIYNVMHEKTQ